jgi:hypothetical protein
VAPMSGGNRKIVRKSAQVTAAATGANHMDTNTSGLSTPGVAWDANLPVAASPYLQTAQAEQVGLVDFHARADVDKIKNRLNTLEAKISEAESSLEGLSAKLDQVSGTPRESISRTLSGLLRNVAAVRSAFISPTSDGYQVILTYPDSMPLVDFLRTVIPVEIEIDKRYKNTYFDFEHVPESDFSIRSFPDARALE